MSTDETSRDPDATMGTDSLLALLASAGEARRAVARVDDGEQVIEVAVGAAGRWSARTSLIEWSHTPDGLASWHVSLAGARPRVTAEASGWVHPAAALLRPEFLRIWGRPGDTHAPSYVTQTPGGLLVGLQPLAAGPASRVIGTSAHAARGTLFVDAARALVTCLDLGGRCWMLVDYRDTPAP